MRPAWLHPGVQPLGLAQCQYLADVVAYLLHDSLEALPDGAPAKLNGAGNDASTIRDEVGNDRHPLVSRVPFGLGASKDTIGATTDAILSPPWRGDREADGDGLENRFRASERGFESHPLRRLTPPLPGRDTPADLDEADRMKLHEYQAKKLLSDYGVPVPQGGVARTPQEARTRAEAIGGPIVVKAQIHAGGRGKAGGILTAHDAGEAEQAAGRLLGSRLRTAQTGASGLPVHAVLIERSAAPEREFYLGLLVDPSRRRPVFVVSAHGGTEIEELATRHPEELASTAIDPVTGLLAFQARGLARQMGLEGTLAGRLAQLMSAIYKLFVEKDCSLVEINPLVVTAAGELLALDAKVALDDNALFRQQDLSALRDDTQLDPLEQEAARIGVSYVKMDGSIGCLVNGAGLAMATMDIVGLLGGKPANFLDVGGTADENRIADAFELLLDDPDVRVAWVNIFGGILRCDMVARALLRVYAERKPAVPFVVRMQGTNAEEATRLLAASPISVLLEPELAAAARLAVAAATATAQPRKDAGE